MGKRQQCEGYRMYGSFMTFGPRKWERCKNNAEFFITTKLESGGASTLPGCAQCLQDCKDEGILEDFTHIQPPENKS